MKRKAEYHGLIILTLSNQTTNAYALNRL
uniref:Uncharacterized protein n=1 Tax=Rhizophora mucronata TaxID=61149 RepID=A0A2P2J7Q0_RHIMU